MTTPPLDPRDFEEMRHLIEAWCGISLGDDKLYLVETRLRTLATEGGFGSFRELCREARRASPELRDRIIDDITTNETSWFRDPHTWELVRNVAIPGAVERAIDTGKRRVSIWSAACSTGQEPYSIAILLREMERASELRGLPADRFEILATDVSASALALAERGRYDPISMRRGLGEPLRDRWFDLDGRTAILHDDVKKLVRFKRHNLLDGFGALGRFDIVFLRNVLIYFSASGKRALLGRLRPTLHDEGALIGGGTETFELYSSEFDVVRSGRSVHYCPKER